MVSLATGHLTDIVEVIDAVDATAAGTTDVNGSTIDMDNAQGCLFIFALGTLTATQVTITKVQESEDDSTWSDVSSATYTWADSESDQLALLDVRRPAFTMRYIRAVVDRGTANAVIDAGIAIKYQHNIAAPTQGENSSTTIADSTQVP